MWALWIGMPFVPVSWVLKALYWCPTEFSLGCQMSQAVLKSWKYEIS